MVTEKVYKVFLGRLSEAAAMYERHRNEVWYEQLIKNSNKLQEIFQEQQKEIERLKVFYDYFAELYGKGLGVANWHMNGELEPFDDFFNSALKRCDD